jgi:hypothetical protein
MSIDQLGFETNADSRGSVTALPTRARATLEGCIPRGQPAGPMGKRGSGERRQPTPRRSAESATDPITLAEIESARLFDLEQRWSAREIVPLAERHMNEVAALIAVTHREPSRHRLVLAGGQAAALAGWLAFDLNDAMGAHHHWNNAIAAAQHTASGPLLACVFTYLSYSSAERGDLSTA